MARDTCECHRQLLGECDLFSFAAQQSGNAETLVASDSAALQSVRLNLPSYERQLSIKNLLNADDDDFLMQLEE